MKDFYPILEKCALFQGIDRTDLPGMLACLGARVTTVGRHQAIFSEGDEANFVGILLSGSAQILKEDFYGDRSIVSTVLPGELFGESFACAGVPSLPVSIVASEDAEVMILDSRRIGVSCSNACAFHSRMIYNLLKIVAGRNLEFNKKLDIMSRRTTRDKLMAYLLGEAKRNGSNSFSIPYDRQGLADFLAVERSAMSAEISKLRREGVLESEKNHFKLLQ